MTKISRLMRGAVMIGLVVSLAAYIVQLPESSADSLLHFRNAVVVLVGIVLVGKVLYDTLFAIKRVI